MLEMTVTQVNTWIVFSKIRDDTRDYGRQQSPSLASRWLSLAVAQDSCQTDQNVGQDLSNEFTDPKATCCDMRQEQLLALAYRMQLLALAYRMQLLALAYRMQLKERAPSLRC